MKIIVAMKQGEKIGIFDNESDSQSTIRLTDINASIETCEFEIVLGFDQDLKVNFHDLS